MPIIWIFSPAKELWEEGGEELIDRVDRLLSHLFEYRQIREQNDGIENVMSRTIQLLVCANGKMSWIDDWIAEILWGVRAPRAVCELCLQAVRSAHPALKRIGSCKDPAQTHHYAYCEYFRIFWLSKKSIRKNVQTANLKNSIPHIGHSSLKITLWWNIVMKSGKMLFWNFSNVEKCRDYLSHKTHQFLLRLTIL